MSTGNLSTIAFATSGFTARYQEIGELRQTRGRIEDSELSTTDFKSYIPEDLAEPGERELKIFWKDDDALPDINGDPELVTVTHRLKSGQTAAATSQGSAFITEITADPMHANNQIKSATIKIQYDNKATPPSYTPATTS